MLRAGTRSRLTVLVTAALLACHDEPAPSGDDVGDAGDGNDNGNGDTDTGEPEPIPGDSCRDDPFVLEAPAALTAVLRGASPDPEGIGQSCGLTGPTMFVRVHVTNRADVTVRVQGHSYAPRLAALAPGCVSELEDPLRLLACGELLPITLADVGPDRDLLLAVGVDADDPALDLPAPEDPQAHDPLEFRLELSLRAVLGEGERCDPAYGRCEAGTVCLPVIEGEGEESVEELRCVRPPADSCAAPGELSLPAIGEAPLVLMIPGDEPHSDAHEHSCTGWRRPERVDRLLLPASLPADARLQITASDPRVGLAVRAPSCIIDDARACAPANVAGATQTILSWGQPGELATLAEDGAMPYLFIELPRAVAGDAPQPIAVSLEWLNP